MPLPLLTALLLGTLPPAPPVATLAHDTALLTTPDLPGWELVTTPAATLPQVAVLRADGVLAVTGAEPRGFLATTTAHHDYRLHVEWRWSGKPGNSGVLVHIASGPRDRVWPLCFQIQTKHGAAGDLLPMAGATFAEKLSTPPDAKTPQLNHAAPGSEKPAGEWNECDILCSRDVITVFINGVLQNRVSGCTPAAGRLGFQLEGAPFELRNLRLADLE